MSTNKIKNRKTLGRITKQDQRNWKRHLARMTKEKRGKTQITKSEGEDITTDLMKRKKDNKKINKWLYSNILDHLDKMDNF